MLGRVVGGVWNNSVSKCGFLENSHVHTCWCFVDGYVQVVECVVFFCFFSELQVGVE